MSLDDLRAEAHAISKDSHELELDRREETARRYKVDAELTLPTGARRQHLLTRAASLTGCGGRSWAPSPLARWPVTG